jgi:hypothetical protein
MRLRPWLGIALAAFGCGAQRTSTQTPTEVAPDGGASTEARGETKADASENKPASQGTERKDAGEGLPISVATAKAHADGKHYALDVTSTGTVTVGGSGAFQIALAAKDGYHINDEFPYKLKTRSEPQSIVSFAVAELSRKDGAYTKTDARFEAKFTGAKAGVAKIGGTMSLSVCSKKECIVDKIELEVPVTVR